MMPKVITLAGYGISSPDVHIATEHILSFWEIEYNGRSGTEIMLSNGKNVRVNESPWKIKSILGEL